MSKKPSLLDTHPELTKQWHPTKNGELKPDDVTRGSDKIIWWKCDKANDHAWKAKICDRTKKNPTHCPYCSNQKVLPSKLNSLEKMHPEIAKEWHSIKNNKKPSEVVPGSGIKVWWKCQKGHGHEWEAKVVDRIRNGTGCPYCSNRKVNQSNCLAKTHPEILSEWHKTKNTITPYDVHAGSNKKIWWQCGKQSDHVWETSVLKRTQKNGTKCPFCSNQKTTHSNSLIMTHPEIAAQWDTERNGDLTPHLVNAGSKIKIWWKCNNADDHIWETKIIERTGRDKTTCPMCKNKKVVLSNCLATTHPEIATQWHPTKNGELTPKMVTAGSDKIVWWKCENGDDHVWKARVYSRSGKNLKCGCPICGNRKIVPSNSLETTHPHIAKEWHPTKNIDTSASAVSAQSHKKVWWKCGKGDEHEWEAAVRDRAKVNGTNCPVCANKKTVLSNSIVTTHPEIAKQWNATKNTLRPNDVSKGSNKKIWWQCDVNSDHVWEAQVNSRTGKYNTGCPFCNSGWTMENIRSFVKSLLPYIDRLEASELYVLLQQNGMIASQGARKEFVKAFTSGKLPKSEIEKFCNDQQSVVDDLFNSNSIKINEGDNAQLPENCISEFEYMDEKEFPLITTQDTLEALDKILSSTADEEAIDYFIKSAVNKVWKYTFLNEGDSINQLKKYSDDGLYSKKVKELFLEDYNRSKSLEIPNGYQFEHQPSLMQRYTAYLVQSRKRIGNWSGTGAGKTLSAILASRVIDAKLTVICCPNNVVENWEKEILGIYPDSSVFSKQINILSENKNTYLILNYEFFQQRNAEPKIKKFLEKFVVDFVVIDEIHYSKQREVEKMSKRKKVISAFLYESSEKNENLRVLGMSATPVINNLHEGKTLIEMVTGLSHDDLQTTATISNCIQHYQKFITNGIRWLPKYEYKISVVTDEIDCSGYLEEIKSLGNIGSMVQLESILTRAKIPYILEKIKRKTIVYTHYLKDILPALQDSIEKNGWRVATYTGENKDGLEKFINKDADVLIASSCAGTGVNGLQKVCNRMIINSLPWTHAEFEQLKGRLYRQGQTSDHVDIFVPITFSEINGEKWSWCESRWKRIQFKKSISDAAVDGVIPDGHLRTSAQAYQDTMSWLDRLQFNKTYEIRRRKIVIPLSEAIEQTTRAKLGTLVEMNFRINNENSEKTNQRFQKYPEEWEYYHSTYREDRKTWQITPYQEAIEWAKKRPHLVIGDFGCGEALLASSIENKVYSFDHVAINNDVVACDMSHVPLDDYSLDAAIFSLSLMGTNFIDYLKEANRCLKLDGHLWIAEPTSRINDQTLFSDFLFRLGFDVIKINQKWKFTFIRAIKTDRGINIDVLNNLNYKDVLQ